MSPEHPPSQAAIFKLTLVFEALGNSLTQCRGLGGRRRFRPKATSFQTDQPLRIAVR
jgi:hypothetical protein